jgi:DNA-binding FrmR family transcriptional regulator
MEGSRMINDECASKARTRLRKIEGQLRGLQKMIDDRRYCVDVLDQISAVQAALGGVGKLLLKNHIETCVARALSGDDERERRQKVEELVKIYGRFCKIS